MPRESCSAALSRQLHFCAKGYAACRSECPVQRHRFHHIKSPTKRKRIVEWADELDIGGYSVIGYPGIIICEGVQHQNILSHKGRGF